MKIDKAIQILIRRVDHLRARAAPGDTGKSYDLAEIAALVLAIEHLRMAEDHCPDYSEVVDHG